MMDDVVLNDAVEKMAPDEAKVAIDSSQRTLDKCPVLGLEMRNVNVSMVKVSDGN